MGDTRLYSFFSLPPFPVLVCCSVQGACGSVSVFFPSCLSFLIVFPCSSWWRGHTDLEDLCECCSI